MINRYRKYLSIIDAKLAKMFKQQAPFIKCKKGCVHCCSDGEYPMSELEYINLMFEYESLDSEIKSKIEKNIRTLLSQERPKMYACPFLIDGECSVYPARAIICRTFGLMSFYKDERKKMPFCVELELNYSNAINKTTGKIEYLAPDGTEPVAFNIDRRTLRDKNMEETFNILFGEDKALYDWLKEDFKN